jgi:hypothetical protein
MFVSLPILFILVLCAVAVVFFGLAMLYDFVRHQGWEQGYEAAKSVYFKP